MQEIRINPIFYCSYDNNITEGANMRPVKACAPQSRTYARGGWG